MILQNYFYNIITLGFLNLFHFAPAHFSFPGSFVFDRLIDFHDYILIYLIFILIVFCWFLLWSIYLYKFSHFFYTFALFIRFLIAFITFLIVENFRLLFSASLTIYYLQIKHSLCGFIRCFIRLFHINRSFSFVLSVRTFFSIVSFSARKEFVKQTRRKVHAPLLEIFWTVFPSFILLFIAIPSIYLLYIMDAVEPLSYAVKVIGHQWYWSYEIGNSSPLFKTITTSLLCSFDSYLTDNTPRLLAVDNALFVPSNIPITFFITSTDVIHSWSVPSLGIKVDAIPGRLNQVCTIIFDINRYYGQCSELCGVNHGFMPINVISLVDCLKLI